ncbi:hypothetical protein CONPUDRAFT_144699 [Coniophora puteana RWD-64-598 SS2]|uniref:Uncharacterized protein n=1 Tax=Coniophora puteana (strain RWD-64-598) TaxID=741705 RepID=A0A5M3MQ05_CONPW|nr:uncharacterized protein CONPUDRAFT_144699 [Coniophora puteana RWD-64-598 SS2]EIW80755.1 hypothetical protein CONPUDRAFT_144699 [Coniophora puteana RWD-64-598 SS2]
MPSASKAADIVTYRHEGEMVYVQPPQSHEQAVCIAREVYPRLASVDARRIAFAVNVINGVNSRTVRISPHAWSKMMSHLLRYEVIDIQIQPEIIVTAPGEFPPDYATAQQTGLNIAVDAAPCRVHEKHCCSSQSTASETAERRRSKSPSRLTAGLFSFLKSDA